MKGTFGFPNLYEVINKTQDIIIIIDLLGPNLEDIMYNLPNKKFSIKTSLMIFNQILQRIKDLHEKDIEILNQKILLLEENLMKE